MGKSIREAPRALELEPVSLSELIHREIRVAIETAVHEELRAALATTPYECSQLRRGSRNGTKTRTLTGPTGPVALSLPRATLFAGAKERTSRIAPRYHRRMPEVNEAIVATYLAGDYRLVSDVSRVVKIPVLRCTAAQDIKAKPPGRWATRSVSSGIATLEYGAASPRYTAPPAVFAMLRGHDRRTEPTG